jgi:hypothetical protein
MIIIIKIMIIKQQKIIIKKVMNRTLAKAANERKPKRAYLPNGAKVIPQL